MMTATTWGAALVTWLVQGALVLGFATVVALALRRAAAALRHLVRTLAVILLLAMPLPFVTRPLLEPLAPRTSLAESKAASGPAAVPAKEPAQLWALRVPLPPVTSPASRLLLLVWGAGATLLLLRLAAARLALRRLRGMASPILDPAATALLSEAIAALGWRRRVRLFAADVAAPAACGVLAPAVLLPRHWARWQRPRLRMALLHEVAHLRRHDPATQLAAELLRALHWIDPLAWLTARALAHERELACDDAVLRAGVRRDLYAATIVEAARDLRGRPAPLLPALTSQDLEARLRAVVDPRRRREAVSRRQATTLLLLLVAAALPASALVLAMPDTTLPELPASLAGVDDPLSELLPDAPLASAGDFAGARDAAAIRRLQEGARHVKTWEGDLIGERSRWALRQVERGDVVTPLLRHLGSSDWRVQSYAAWGLAVAGDARAVPALLKLVEHPVWRVRMQAIASLGDLRGEIAPPVLEKLARDPAWQVRVLVVAHLARRADAPARGELRRLAGDRHIAVRDAARAALAG